MFLTVTSIFCGGIYLISEYELILTKRILNEMEKRTNKNYKMKDSKMCIFS